MISIAVTDLCKNYGDHPALTGLTFSVEKGEIFGLLGANGAGKTTTLEILEGLRKQSSGTFSLSGKLGVQLQSASLPDSIHCEEALALFSRWHGLAPDAGLLERFGLAPLVKKPYHTLSTGQKRRLHLALALIGEPDIILLDEPTAGLDVAGRMALHECIRTLKQKGKTILLASHDMAEVQSLCDRLVIIKSGKAAFTGTPEALARYTAGEKRLAFQTMPPLSTAGLTACRLVGTGEAGQLFEGEDLAATLEELLEAAREQGATVLGINTQHTSLDEAFLEVTKEAVK